MSEHTQGNRDLLYGLHDRPAPAKAFLGATQHVLASFVGIITPSLILTYSPTFAKPKRGILEANALRRLSHECHKFSVSTGDLYRILPPQTKRHVLPIIYYEPH